LEPKSEVDISLEILPDQGAKPLTIFSNFVASQNVSSKEQIVTEIHEYLGISTKGMVEEVCRTFSFEIYSYIEISISRAIISSVEIQSKYQQFKNFCIYTHTYTSFL